MIVLFAGSLTLRAFAPDADLGVTEMCSSKRSSVTSIQNLPEPYSVRCGSTEMVSSVSKTMCISSFELIPALFAILLLSVSIFFTVSSY